jgi:hypothetical protein
MMELLHRLRRQRQRDPGRSSAPPLHPGLGRQHPDRSAGVRWLLEHGADANLAWSEFGDAPLHIAAERWDVPMVELQAVISLPSCPLPRRSRRVSEGRGSGCLSHWFPCL